ncbi:MAG: long-chain fatty acid transporter [Caulobacterales bacterium 32-69-10]|nr:MAG: long-chain fatty acid transporter [Caulobacterales bacterium 32-69-10]
MRSLCSAASAGAILAAIAASPALASGFYVQEQSAKAVGRAFSGEAADTGATSLWWNPAAIAGISGRAEGYVGMHYVTVDAKVRDAGSTIQRPGQAAAPVGGAQLQNDPIDKGYIPNMAGAVRLNDQLVFGLAVTAPFNFTTRYDLNSFTRYEALKSRLFNIDIQPTLAWRPIPQLDIGVGLDASYADATLSNALPNLSPLLPDGGSNLTGNGWDWGWVAGVQVRPTPGVTLAASYRDGIKHKLDGQVTVTGLLGPAAAANVDTAGLATFSTPSILTFGASWKATDRLTLNAQVQRFDWSAFDAIRVEFGGRTQVTPQDYNDTTSIAVGADYAVTPQWTLRGGVQRDPTPTPDPGRTARVPDGDRWLFSLGTTYAARENLNFDVGAMYIAFKESDINSSAGAFGGTPLSTPINMRGSVEGRGLVLSVGARMGF